MVQHLRHVSSSPSKAVLGADAVPANNVCIVSQEVGAVSKLRAQILSSDVWACLERKQICLVLYHQGARIVMSRRKQAKESAITLCSIQEATGS